MATDEDFATCVECGHTLSGCICNIEDELTEFDSDEVEDW